MADRAAGNALGCWAVARIGHSLRIGWVAITGVM